MVLHLRSRNSRFLQAHSLLVVWRKRAISMGSSSRIPLSISSSTACHSKHTSTSHRLSQSANIRIHLTDCHSQQIYQYITQTVTVSKHTSTSPRLSQCKYQCIFSPSQSVNTPVYLTVTICHSAKYKCIFSLSQSVNTPVHPSCYMRDTLQRHYQPEGEFKLEL